METKQLQELSYIDLSELQSLMYDINVNVDKYSHVSAFLPNTLKKQIKNFTDMLSKEGERREGLY